MAEANGGNPEGAVAGQSRWLVEGPGDTCLNAMAVIRVAGDFILALPNAAAPLDEEQAEGVYRMLMSARDAISTVHSHLERESAKVRA